MNIRKTVSVDNELLRAWLKQYPASNKNFSKSIEGAMIALLNDPRIYWRSQAKYYQQRFQSALHILEALEAKEQENERAKNAQEARQEVVFSRR